MAEQEDPASHTRQSSPVPVSKQRPLIPTDKIYEKLSRDLQNSLVDTKKCIDGVLEMRARCAELVLEVSSINNPELMLNILKCNQMVSKLEGHTQQEETEAPIFTEEKQ